MIQLCAVIVIICASVTGILSGVLENENNRKVIVDGHEEYIENDMGMDKDEYKEIFGNAPDEKEFPKEELKRQRRSRRVKRTSIVRDSSKLWTNGIIPYEITKSHFSSYQLLELSRVMRFYEEETCIKFKKRTTEARYVVIEDCGGEDNCWSHLGMSRTMNRQLCCLGGYGCKWYGLFFHELGHTIGLLHEHQREDRDAYVWIDWNRVKDGSKNKFIKAKYGVEKKTKEYDFRSVMQYQRESFSKGGNTINAKNDGDNARIGKVWYKMLSFLDVKTINEGYRCAKHCGTKMCYRDSFLDKHCNCLTKEAYYKKRCVNLDRRGDAYCNKWAAAGHCKTNDTFMLLRCRKACKAC